MDLAPHMTSASPLTLDVGMYDVFDRFRSDPAVPFLPVVGEEGEPLGVVREYDLKNFAYGMFGRELIRKYSVSDFLRECVCCEHEGKIEEILMIAAQNPNPDGLILTENGKYKALLLVPALLKLYDELRLESQIRLSQAQKMEAIGNLAGGIAHDFNNILMPILGYAELTKKMLETGVVPEAGYLEQIIQGAHRAKDLVNQILAFSRQRKNDCHPVKVSIVVKEVLKLMRPTLPSTISIVSDIKEKDAMILADPTEIHQVFMNLCTNAYHAMREEGGILTVSVDSHQGQLLGWSEHENYHVDEQEVLLRVTIRDTGKGISPNMLPRIFEPFFTTKKQGEGTGMGLSVVHGIIMKYKGAISVESTAKGTAFHIYFRTCDEFVQNRPSFGDSPETVEQSKENLDILFVDDEVMITDIARKMLSNYGITVVPVNDSREALVLFEKDPRRFDCVVTDQTMPGLTGADLTRNMLRVRPDIPIVICTGYSDTLSAESALLIGARDYVLKPMDFRKLNSMIRRLCADKRRRNASSVTASA
ncbi:MAG: response regulator [Chitinispirillaceae bacterium]